MKVHKESHVDHGLTEEQLAYLVNMFADRDAFFIETVELPEHLGTVSCGLHGPVMGDAPVPETEVHYAVRGNRAGKSRLVGRAPRPTRLVSVIAGPHEEEPCILYTAFGGPVAPKEPFDAEGEERTRSEAFWAEHALSE